MIGEGAVIGAGTVMVKDAEPWGVYAGKPSCLPINRVKPEQKKNKPSPIAPPVTKLPYLGNNIPMCE